MQYVWSIESIQAFTIRVAGKVLQYMILWYIQSVHNKTNLMWFTLKVIFELQYTLPLSLPIEKNKTE